MATPVEVSTETMMGTKSLEFTVTDWDLALPAIQSLAQDYGAGASGPVFSDWTRSNNQLAWRSTFHELNPMLEIIKKLGPVLTDIPGATLDKFVTHAPTEWLPAIRDATEDLQDVYYYETPAGMRTGCYSKTGSDVPPFDDELGTLCSSHPEFTIRDWDSAKYLVDEYINRTRGEKDCIYFGWTRLGNSLHWQAYFPDGDALRYHYQNVRGLLDALTEGPNPPASLDHFRIHGPAAELDKCRSIAQGIRHIFFETDERIKKLKQN